MTAQVKHIVKHMTSEQIQSNTYIRTHDLIMTVKVKYIETHDLSVAE